MARVFLLHWERMEMEERAALLRQAGHTVSSHWSTEAPPNLRESLPDIAVISLDRLPSHGRAVAEWLWEAKKRQHIPIVFAGGVPEKVAVTREKFPRAVYCPTSDIVSAVAQVLRSRSNATNADTKPQPRGRAQSNKRPIKSRTQSRAARG